MTDSTLGLLVMAVEDGFYEGRPVQRGQQFRIGTAQAIRQPAAPPGGVWVRATAGPNAGPGNFAGSYRHDSNPLSIRRNHGDVFQLREGDQIGSWMEPGRLRPVDPDNPDATLEERFVYDPRVLPGWKGTKWTNGRVPHMKAEAQVSTFSELNKAKDQEELARAAAKTSPIPVATPQKSPGVRVKRTPAPAVAVAGEGAAQP